MRINAKAGQKKYKAFFHASRMTIFQHRMLPNVGKELVPSGFLLFVKNSARHGAGLDPTQTSFKS